MESRRNGPQLSSRHDDDDNVGKGPADARFPGETHTIPVAYC